MYPLKSIYLPKDALQGSEFPAHIMWDSSVEIQKIIIELPAGVSLKEIYNVPKEGLNIIEEERNIVEISSFEVNGYVGMVFISKKLEEPYKKACLRFRVILNNPSADITKKRI